MPLHVAFAGFGTSGPYVTSATRTGSTPIADYPPHASQFPGGQRWNTIYIDAALAQLRQEGYPVRDEDVARLSPFVHERHINLLGRYSFIVPEAVTRGELRPLRNPNDADA
jgi:hypothetical protein